MEKRTIVASAVNGDKRELIGSEEVDKPTNVEEAFRIYGSEEKLLTYAWKSYVIEVQARLRNGGIKSGDRGLARSIDKAITFAKANPDSEVAKVARRLGLIS